MSRTPQTPPPEAGVLQWLDYLEQIHPRSIDLGLERVLLVFRRLFPGPPPARIVSIAGTNGKGSTATALSALLQEQGRTVGLYTSPHLLRFNERIRLNGREVDDGRLVAAFQAVEAARRQVSLTYFEFTTLAAMVVFRDSGMTDWVMEVGLGGRLDAVNCLDAHLAIITAIDIDHSDWLGDDRNQIGYEKAGILRPETPAICADPDPPPSITQQARAQRVPLYRLGESFGLSPGGRMAFYQGAQGDRRQASLAGASLPPVSWAAALQALALLGHDIPGARLAGVLAGTGLAGRYQRWPGEPEVLLDVGHNPHAARWLAGQLAREADQRPVHAVFGGLADKDTRAVLEALAPQVSRWYPAALDVPRGLDAQALTERFRQAGLDPGGGYPGVAQALCAAQENAGAGGRVLVCGSFYTVAAAIEVLQKPGD